MLQDNAATITGRRPTPSRQGGDPRSERRAGREEGPPGRDISREAAVKAKVDTACANLRRGRRLFSCAASRCKMTRPRPMSTPRSGRSRMTRNRGHLPVLPLCDPADEGARRRRDRQHLQLGGGQRRGHLADQGHHRRVPEKFRASAFCSGSVRPEHLLARGLPRCSWLQMIPE